MKRLKPTFKRAVNVYTLLLLAFIVTFFVIGMIINNKANTDENYQSQYPSFSTELLNDKLAMQGVFWQDESLYDADGIEWGTLRITQREGQIASLVFETRVYPTTAQNNQSEVWESLNEQNELSLKRIGSILKAIRNTLVESGDISDASAKQTYTIIERMESMLIEQTEYAWSWGEYSCSAVCKSDGELYHLSCKMESNPSK